MQGGKRTVLVTEYLEKGDLCTALGRSPSRYSWNRLGRGIALDVAHGLVFLHSLNIVHFDLKSANILLDKDNRAKLADVGLAKTLTHSNGSDQLSTFMATGDLGTFAWAAPEVRRVCQLYPSCKDINAGRKIGAQLASDGRYM